MTRHYPDLGCASDWLNQISHASRPIRSTTQIWVVTRHQYSISALVSQTLFGGETNGSAAKCRMSSQDMTRDVLWSARKIDENYFFFGIQTGDKLAKHRSLLLFLDFSVTVAIWQKEVVSCPDFILRSVATFWVMSLVGSYPGRGLT